MCKFGKMKVILYFGNWREKMNPYDVLGVSKDASDQEIKRAYRKLSKNIIQI